MTSSSKITGGPVKTIYDPLPDGLYPGDLGHQLVAELLMPANRDAVRRR